jgi:hypothetical protein
MKYKPCQPSFYNPDHPGLSGKWCGRDDPLQDLYIYEIIIDGSIKDLMIILNGCPFIKARHKDEDRVFKHIKRFQSCAPRGMPLETPGG